MVVELIDKTRLLIILDGTDMLAFDFTFDDFFWEDPHSKQIVKDLLEIAKERTGFSADDKKLMIEAIPQGDGCMILFTLLPSKKDGKRKTYKIKNSGEPFVYVFENSDNLLNAVEKLFNMSNSSYDSQLLFYKNKYYLIINASNGLPPPMSILLSEYGNLKGKGKRTFARISEYGKTIIDKNAIQKIGSYLT